jgi:hypothetical protein
VTILFILFSSTQVFASYGLSCETDASYSKKNTYRITVIEDGNSAYYIKDVLYGNAGNAKTVKLDIKGATDFERKYSYNDYGLITKINVSRKGDYIENVTTGDYGFRSTFNKDCKILSKAQIQKKLRPTKKSNASNEKKYQQELNKRKF